MFGWNWKEAYVGLEKWFYIYWMNLKFLALVRRYFWAILKGSIV